MKPIEPIEESIYSLMQKMCVGEKIVVPLEAWKKVSGFSTRFKKDMGRQYSIYRMETSRSKVRFVLVTRTK